MAAPKTRPTKLSVTGFIATVTPEQRRLDALALLKIMKRATGEKPELWGPNIVGYGRYLLRYASGRELEWPLVGFSPRKTSLVLYLKRGFPRFATLLAKLGKHKTSGGCLYIRELADVDAAVLEQLVRASADHGRKQHGGKE